MQKEAKKRKVSFFRNHAHLVSYSTCAAVDRLTCSLCFLDRLACSLDRGCVSSFSRQDRSCVSSFLFLACPLSLCRLAVCAWCASLPLCLVLRAPPLAPCCSSLSRSCFARTRAAPSCTRVLYYPSWPTPCPHPSPLSNNPVDALICANTSAHPHVHLRTHVARQIFNTNTLPYKHDENCLPRCSHGCRRRRPHAGSVQVVLEQA